MSGLHKPEMIIGVEGGIGYFTPSLIPGPITEFLCKIAQKFGIYFIPGTLALKLRKAILLRLVVDVDDLIGPAAVLQEPGA